MCQPATSCPAGSFGLFATHPERSPPQLSPSMITGCFAPAPRTALISCCSPAAFQPPGVVQPFSQQAQEMSCGSLNRSNATPRTPLYFEATDDQNAGEWSASGACS